MSALRTPTAHRPIRLVTAAATAAVAALIAVPASPASSTITTNPAAATAVTARTASWAPSTAWAWVWTDLGPTAGGDQYVQARVAGATDADSNAALVLRKSGTSFIAVNVSGTRVQVHTVVGGTMQTQLDRPRAVSARAAVSSRAAVSARAAAAGSPGVARAEVVGSTVRVFWNGALVASSTSAGYLSFSGRGTGLGAWQGAARRIRLSAVTRGTLGSSPSGSPGAAPAPVPAPTPVPTPASAPTAAPTSIDPTTAPTTPTTTPTAAPTTAPVTAPTTPPTTAPTTAPIVAPTAAPSTMPTSTADPGDATQGSTGDAITLGSKAVAMYGRPRSGLPWHSGFWTGGTMSTARMNQAQAWVGRPFDMVTTYPGSATWAQIADSDWAVGIFDGFAGRISYGLPLLPADRRGQWADVTSGAHDATFRTVARQLVAHGRSDAAIRVGVEANGDWFPYAVTAATAAQYRQAFRRVVTVMRAEAPHLTFWLDLAAGSGLPGQAHRLDTLTLMYPGDDVVDGISIDHYDSYELTARSLPGWSAALQPSDGPGLADAATFARAHRKGLAVPEWGLHATKGAGDNPFFIQQMHAFFTANRDILVYECYFNEPDPYIRNAIWGPVQLPRSSAEYLRLF